MIVYRIADCQYINDLSGYGAARFGGRWNSKEVYMLYTAETPSLALLEAVVHMGKIPSKRYCMITIEVPGKCSENFNAANLPADWLRSPPPDYLRAIGDNFIRHGKWLAMGVPSVIMPEERNFLLNPAHAAFKQVKIVQSRTMAIDERLTH